MQGFRVFLELSQKVSKDLHQWYKHEGELSFDNLFGDDKVRVVLPLAENEWGKIKQKIEALKDKKTGQPKGYHVDLAKGIVTQTGTTLIGKPFSRQIKLGKVIEQELGPEEKAYYNRVGNPTADAVKNIKYSVVVSRHPIDIARMSDHEGISDDEENQHGIESCHSPGGSYFDCALDEAKGHGPVAYLVRSDDLAKVPDLQQDEIFKDPDRNIPGIVPVGRIRLRRFTNEKKDYDLAIPESRMYGISSSSDTGKAFLDAVLNWSRKEQADLTKGQKPSMKDFTRRGGSYRDTAAGTLFNKFFDTQQYSGDTSHEGEDGQNLADQYAEEIDRLDRETKFKNKIHCSADVEDADAGEPYVWCSGSILFEFDDDENGFRWDKWEEADYKKTREWKSEIQDAAEKATGEYGVEEIEIENARHNTDRLHIRFDMRVESSNGDNGPDQYRDLISTLSDWDAKYDLAEAAIRSKLTELGLMGPSHVEQRVGEWKPDHFRNFTYSMDNGPVVISSHPFHIGNTKEWHIQPPTQTHYRKFDDGGSYSTVKDDAKGIADLKRGVEMAIIQMIRKARTMDRQQLVLPFPGVKRGFLPSPKWPLGKMDIEIKEVDKYGDDKNLTGQIIFKLMPSLDQKTLINTEYYIKFLDARFPEIVGLATRMFHAHVHPHYQKPVAPAAPVVPATPSV